MGILKFLFAIFLSFIPGLLGIMISPIASGKNSWYGNINHSVLTPAGWVFSAVWTILYFLIGVALFLIMQKQGIANRRDITSAYILFAVNLILNTSWSFVFFGAHSPEYALLVLMTLIIVAIFMARAFFKVSPAAFWLTLPYIIWLMFAFYLNGVIIYLN